MHIQISTTCNLVIHILLDNKSKKVHVRPPTPMSPPLVSHPYVYLQQRRKLPQPAPPLHLAELSPHQITPPPGQPPSLHAKAQAEEKRERCENKKTQPFSLPLGFDPCPFTSTPLGHALPSLPAGHTHSQLATAVEEERRNLPPERFYL